MALPTTVRSGVSPPAGREARLPRSLHPLAWWGWALGLLVAASRTTNPLLLGLIVGVLAVVVAARRPAATWSGAFPAALRLGLVVIIARTLMQVVLGDPVGLHVAFTLPQVALPDFMAGVRLGGIVTWESVQVGVVEGLRLATMIACVGAANSLTPPSRLLRSVPAAVYELGVAVVVALTFAPHLLADARRVSAARRLRGHDEGRLAAFARSSGPVLDGGLERSIQLAAAMDSRGYGRSGPVSARERRAQSALVLAGFVGVLVGLYGLLDASAPRVIGWPVLGAGTVLAVLGIRAAGSRSRRTVYRADPWRWPETATVSVGAAAAATFVLWPTTDLLLVSTPLAWPPLLVLPTLAVLVAAGAAFWTPPLPPGAAAGGSQ